MIDRFHRTHPDFSRWPGIARLPNARMMLHVGAATIENFLVVGEVFGNNQRLARSISHP